MSIDISTTIGSSAGLTLARAFLGGGLIYLVFQLVAGATNSTLGQVGLAVCAVVLATAAAMEMVLSRRSLVSAPGALGLGQPGRRAVVVGAAGGLAMLAFFPAFALVTGTPLTLREGWPWLVLGLFAQHGLAEEVMFRGFVYRRLRQGHSFWPAATLSMLFYAGVHLWLFATMDPSVAIISTLLAAVTAFPYAAMVERGQQTVWLPAWFHGISHMVKLVIMPMVLAWYVVVRLAPYLVFVGWRAEAATRRAALPVELSSDAR